MGLATIPVEPRSPGQVFACLGILEIAEILCGPSEGGFSPAGDLFTLSSASEANPVMAALRFLAAAAVEEQPPDGAAHKGAKREMALPILLRHGGVGVAVGHWADRSSRETLKLYAGNRSAAKIAGDMLAGVLELWAANAASLVLAPFERLAPMGGSFNFDPRGGWTAIDVGYSPDKHKSGEKSVLASPLVEILAAAGLQHARPEIKGRRVGYATWALPLPAALARPALAGALADIPTRHFSFELRVSGKNKVVTFSEEVSSR